MMARALVREVCPSCRGDDAVAELRGHVDACEGRERQCPARCVYERGYEGAADRDDAATAALWAAAMPTLERRIGESNRVAWWEDHPSLHGEVGSCGECGGPVEWDVDGLTVPRPHRHREGCSKPAGGVVRTEVVEAPAAMVVRLEVVQAPAPAAAPPIKVAALPPPPPWPPAERGGDNLAPYVELAPNGPWVLCRSCKWNVYVGAAYWCRTPDLHGAARSRANGAVDVLCELLKLDQRELLKFGDQPATKDALRRRLLAHIVSNRDELVARLRAALHVDADGGGAR